MIHEIYRSWISEKDDLSKLQGYLLELHRHGQKVGFEEFLEILNFTNENDSWRPLFDQVSPTTNEVHSITIDRKGWFNLANKKKHFKNFEAIMLLALTGVNNGLGISEIYEELNFLGIINNHELNFAKNTFEMSLSGSDRSCKLLSIIQFFDDVRDADVACVGLRSNLIFLPVVTKLLSPSATSYVKMHALYALGKLQSKYGVERASFCISKARPIEVRKAALWSLYYIGTEIEPYVDEISEILKERNAEILISAALAFGACGNEAKKRIDSLISCIKNGESLSLSDVANYSGVIRTCMRVFEKITGEPYVEQ